MRKITMLASVAGLALAVAGCSKSEEAAPVASEAAAEPSVDASAAAPDASAAGDEGAADATATGDDRGNPGDRG
jgi:PBP1b-binding outer membrane lipoprotein LpoB